MDLAKRRLIDLPEAVEGDVRLPVPLQFRRGSLREDERASIASAAENLRGIALRTGRLDWSDQRVLDFGCGVKFTQALLQFHVAIQRYVGMDVYGELIQYLTTHVRDPRFTFYPVAFRNAMYNPGGFPLTGDARLPGDTQNYDLIVLQSVFTHFAPDDFLALLQVLRRYCGGDGRLFFTCFIDNQMPHDFLDAVPAQPLLKAYYREGLVRELLRASGWETLSTHDPSFGMQHQFVCRPDSGPTGKPTKVQHRGGGSSPQQQTEGQ